MKTAKQSRFPLRALVMSALAIFLVLFLAMPYFYSITFISGEEFCPQLFQTREFRYQRLPGTLIRISQTKLSNGTSPCSKYVLSHLSTGPTSWQVAKVHNGLLSQSLGPQILIDHLKSTNADGLNVWDVWSFKYPPNAAVLWPMVQEVAVQQLYFCIPDLLRAATDETAVDALKKRLSTISLEAAKTKLRIFLEKPDVNAESELRNWALQMSHDLREDPNFIELRAHFSKL